MVVYDYIKKIVNLMRKYMRKINNRIYKYRTLRWVFPHAYKKYAKLPVDENKVVFIEVRLPELTNSFKLLYNELITRYDYDIHTHFLRNTFVKRREYIQRCTEMMQDIATAKYVFVNEASNVVSCVNIRPETIVTQTWHGCGAFKKFGFSTAELIFGETRKEMLKFPYYKNYTYLTISSAEVAWAYEEAMNLGDNAKAIQAIGTSRTDIFYNQDFIKASYDKLHYFMPESEGKKVILYAPTFRGRVANGQTPDMLNIQMFYKKLGDEYILLIKHHPLVRKPPVIDREYAAFAQDFTDAMSIEELLVVSDICISDYSSLVFEYSLLERPLIFFSYDLAEYFDWRGFYYDYYELAPGPIFKTNLEMIDYIQHIDERFDRKRIQDFRRKFMNACDGQATERLINLVFGEGLKQHRREWPLQGEYHMLPNADTLYSEVQQKAERLQRMKDEGIKIYSSLTDRPVHIGKIVFLYEEKRTESYDRLQSELEKKEDLVIQEYCIQYDDIALCKKIMREIADAAYVILTKQCELIDVLEIRKETEVIQMWDGVFPFEKFGYSSKSVIGGLESERLKIAPLYRNYSLVSVASEKFTDIYKEAFGIKEPQIIKPLGSVATDVLFDEQFRQQACEKFYELFPEAEGKRIILYLPVPRYSLTRPKKRVFVDHKDMNEYLSKEYVLVYYYDEEKKKQPHLSKYYNEFVRNFTDLMTIIELMAVADVMIGDYREETFCFAATGRPIFLYAPDYLTYFYGKDVYFDYMDIAPGPVYTDPGELTQAICNIENYDLQRLELFKQTYLSACDGHAAERIADIISSH